MPSKAVIALTAAGAAGATSLLYSTLTGRPILSAIVPIAGFTPMKLDSATAHNSKVRHLCFSPIDPNNKPGHLKISTAMLIMAFHPGSPTPVVRPYTPVSQIEDANATGKLEFLVKGYEKGTQSKYLHGLRPGAGSGEDGQGLILMRPLAEFEYRPNMHRKVALVAGGSGMTPLWQLMRGILNNPADRTQVTLISSDSTRESSLLRDEIKELQKNFGPERLRVVRCAGDAQVSASGEVDGEGFTKGRISKELLSRELFSTKEDGVKVYACGPEGLQMMLAGDMGKDSIFKGKNLGGVLKEMGFGHEQVKVF